MTTIKRFEDLECWQEARAFVNLIYYLVNKAAFKKDFELVGQVKRSAISSMANIAEGFHRNSKKDFMKFLDYARSSIAETISHCYIALDLNYITETDLNQVKRQADTIWRKVNKLISYLNKAQKP